MKPLPDGTLNLCGWVLLADRPIDRIEVYLEQTRVISVPLVQRKDVADAFDWIPHAGTAGFNFILPLTDKQRVGTAMLELIACDGPTPVGRLSHLVRADVDSFPSPPADYTIRVANTPNDHFFKVGGLKVFGDFMGAVSRHESMSTMKRMLDWGCGCGRVTVHFMAIKDGPEVFGCDIDPLAIDWCNTHLDRGAFAVLRTLPPAPYPDAHFDLIVSFSVFTHLARNVQHAWLQEMHRLLTPGGLFLATTSGEFAFSFVKRVVEVDFPESGIEDSFLDTALDGIAPKGYYRATYQAKNYTIREFGKYFHVLEYIERGGMNFQDLIVLRKTRAE
jgi:SAM-dependent methyltransferase